MSNEKLLHDLIVEQVRQRLSRQYQEIKVNENGCPDLVLLNHGLTLAVLEVETDNSITPEKAAQWKETAHSETKLILMIPKHAKAKVTELLWEKGISDKVVIGTYEIAVTMP